MKGQGDWNGPASMRNHSATTSANRDSFRQLEGKRGLSAMAQTRDLVREPDGGQRLRLGGGDEKVGNRSSIRSPEKASARATRAALTSSLVSDGGGAGGSGRSSVPCRRMAATIIPNRSKPSSGVSQVVHAKWPPGRRMRHASRRPAPASARCQSPKAFAARPKPPSGCGNASDASTQAGSAFGRSRAFSGPW